MKYDFPISTASSIHGLNIDKTIGFVTSHVVAGTNMFSDIAAIFSDAFGGRSESYKRQLASIKHEAIEELIAEAKKSGGNAIVGLSIDLDEVSGGGKSMFMVTASGTSVLIKESNKELLDRAVVPNEVSSDEIEALIFKSQILNSVKQGNLDLSIDTFEKIIEAKIYNTELQRYIFKSLNSISGGIIAKNAEIYFSTAPKEKVIEQLYVHAKEGYELAVSIIKNYNLVDYQRINDCIKSENHKIKTLGLNLCVVNKTTYVKDDIALCESLLRSIDEFIKPISEIYEVKKLVGKKSVWKCICGTEVSAEYNICQNCHGDIFGFSKNKLNNAKVRLSNRLWAMKQAFSCTD